MAPSFVDYLGYSRLPGGQMQYMHSSYRIAKLNISSPLTALIPMREYSEQEPYSFSPYVVTKCKKSR